jgi:hypothetical protein
MKSVQILSETRRHGIELKAVGDRLLFRPAQDVPPELLSAIRTHKTGLLELLGLPEDDGGRVVVHVDKLKEAEAGFSCLDVAPLDVVLCVADPEQPGHWVAYRRTNRHQLGRGDSQATAVLALARAEDDAGRRRGL